MKIENVIEKNRNILIFFTFVSFVTFYRSIFLTFIHDDWILLEKMHNTSFLEYVKPYMDSKKNLIRIGLVAYDWIIYCLFGLNSVILHVLALLINSLNAFLVFLLSDKILKNRLAAFGVGFMYASATIHNQAVSWSLHPPDDICMLFFLASFLLYIRKRNLISGLFFIVALLTKEASVFLPIALVSYTFFFTDVGMKGIAKIKDSLWRARYHIAILLIFLMVRFLFSQNEILPDSHPYKIKLFGLHVVDNALRYLKYILTEIIPTSLYYGRRLLELSFTQEIFIVAAISAVLGTLICYWKSIIDWKLVLFCVLFLGAGLGPVIFLPNHNYAYYLTLPSISFLILIVYFIQKSLELIGLSPNRQKVGLVCYLVLHFILSSINYNHIYAQQSSQAQQSEMSGKLHEYMMENHPDLSSDSIVIIKGMNIFAINRSSALRVWYNDDSLEVFGLYDVVAEGSKFFVKNPLKTQVQGFTGERDQLKIELIKGKTIILDYKDGEYHDITGYIIK